MRLVLPDMTYRQKAQEFIDEFRKYGSEINGSGAVDSYLDKSTYEAWLEKLRADMDIANIPAPRVPALTYFYVREADDRIVGMMNIRLALNDFLRAECGHIGYCIRPTERCRHHATEMLKCGLAVCKRVGINEVLLFCDRENIASANVIRNCGGILESEFYSDFFKETIQKYVVTQ